MTPAINNTFMADLHAEYAASASSRGSLRIAGGPHSALPTREPDHPKTEQKSQRPLARLVRVAADPDVERARKHEKRLMHVLSLFRRGRDTVDIARPLGYSESEAYSLLIEARR